MIHDGEPTGLGVPGAVRICSADGAIVEVPTGQRLRFGRGQEVDLPVPGGQVLSRQAGEITALADGAWVTNISRSHALYVEGEDYHIRLPPVDAAGPTGGWLVSSGTVAVGSMTMLRQGMALQLTVSGERPSGISRTPGGSGREGALPAVPRAGNGHGEPDEITARPLRLRHNTKLFLVAVLLCRPWLLDPSRSPALPTAPEIGRAALELTGASYQLRLLDHDPAFRNRLVEQVNDLLKYLRERIHASGLAQAGTRLTPLVMAGALLSNDVLTRADLAVFDDPDWRSHQEDLWWRTAP